MSNIRFLERAADSVGSKETTLISGAAPDALDPANFAISISGASDGDVTPLSLSFGLPAGPLLPDWRLEQFLPLTVEHEETDGSVIVSDAMLLVYGVGDTESEALEDYLKSLVEYYQLVAEGAAHGSAKDQHELERVRGYFRPSA